MACHARGRVRESLQAISQMVGDSQSATICERASTPHASVAPGMARAEPRKLSSVPSLLR